MFIKLPPVSAAAATQWGSQHGHLAPHYAMITTEIVAAAAAHVDKKNITSRNILRSNKKEGRILQHN